MNTKGIKFLAVLAVLAMAFAAFAVIADAETDDAAYDNVSVINDVKDPATLATGTYLLKNDKKIYDYSDPANPVDAGKVWTNGIYAATGPLTIYIQDGQTIDMTTTYYGIVSNTGALTINSTGTSDATKLKITITEEVGSAMALGADGSITVSNVALDFKVNATSTSGNGKVSYAIKAGLDNIGTVTINLTSKQTADIYGGNRGIWANGSVVLNGGTFNIGGYEAAITAYTNGTVTVGDSVTTVNAKLLDGVGINDQGSDARYAIKAKKTNGTITISNVASVVTTQGLFLDKEPTVGAAAKLIVTGNYIQNVNDDTPEIAGLFIKNHATAKASGNDIIKYVSNASSAVVGKTNVVSGADIDYYLVTGYSKAVPYTPAGTDVGKTIQTAIDAAFAPGVNENAAYLDLSGSDVTDYSGENALTIPAGKAVEINFKAASNISGTIDVSNATELTVTNLKVNGTDPLVFIGKDNSKVTITSTAAASFSVRNGSVIIEDITTSGTLTVKVNGAYEIFGTVSGTGTVSIEKETGATTATVDIADNLFLTGTATVTVTSLPVHIHGKVSVGAGTTLTFTGSSVVKVFGEVYVEGTLLVDSTTTANAQLEIKEEGVLSTKAGGSGTITVDSEKKIIAWSGSDINGIDTADFVAIMDKIVGKDVLGGEWTYSEAAGVNTLTLNNYNGTYNFKPISDKVTNILLLGENEVSFEADSSYKGYTFFGGVTGKLAKIETDTVAGSLAINVDLSAVAGDDLATYSTKVIDPATTFDFDEVTVTIAVGGANKTWTNDQLIAMNTKIVGIENETKIGMLNSSVSVSVMPVQQKGDVAFDAVKTATIELKASGLVAVGDVTASTAITVSNSSSMIVSGLTTAKAIDNKQESTITVNDLYLEKAGTSTNKSAFHIMGDSIIAGTFTNNGTMTNAGNMLIIKNAATAYVFDNADGTFTNTGTVKVPAKYVSAANVGLNIANADMSESDATVKVTQIVLTEAGSALNEDGSLKINAATVKFTKHGGFVPGIVYEGTMTVNQDGTSYTINLTNETSSIVVTYDSTKEDAEIGSKYTITAKGTVMDGTTSRTISANAKESAVTKEGALPDTALVDNTGSLTVTGGKMVNEGTVIVSHAAEAEFLGTNGAYEGALTSDIENITLKGDFDGNLISNGAGTVTIDGTFDGNIAAYGSVTINTTGVMTGDIVSQGTVTVKKTLNGNVMISNSDVAQALVVTGGKMVGKLDYVTEYYATKDATVKTIYQAIMDIDGEGTFTINTEPGNNATSDKAVKPGYFSLTSLEAKKDKTVTATLEQGTLAIEAAADLKKDTVLIIEDDTTLEVGKAFIFDVSKAALKVADGAIRHYGTELVPSDDYGDVSYVMSFDIEGGTYTIYSNIAYALSNCDEGSELTLGVDAEVDSNVSLKAGINVIVKDVTLTFTGKNVEMGEGAKITIDGNGMVKFAETGKAATTEAVFTVSGTIVYDDNTLVFSEVRFDNESTIAGIEATATEDSKLDVSLSYKDGIATIKEGYGKGIIALANGTEAKVKDATPVKIYATFVVGANAVFDATSITDAATKVKYKAAEPEVTVPEIKEYLLDATIVGVEGTLNLLDNTTIKGAYVGTGKATLADNKVLTLDSAQTAAFGGERYIPGSLNLYIVDTTEDSNGYLFNLVTTQPENDGTGLVLTATKYTMDDEKVNVMKISGKVKVGAIKATTAAVLDELTVMKDAVIYGEEVYVVGESTATGYVGAKVIYMKETDNDFKELHYQVTFTEEDYTVYTMLASVEWDEISNLTIHTNVGTPEGKKIDLSGHDVDITIADDAKLTVNGVLIIGTPATVLGDDGSSIVGKVVIANGCYIIAYSDVDLTFAEILASNGTTDAVFSKLDVEDMPYAAIFASNLAGEQKVILSKADAAIVPEIVGFNFTAWLNYNGDAQAEVGTTNAYADAKAVLVTVIVKYVAGVDYYMNGVLFNVYDIPTDVAYGTYFTAKISDTSKYQGNPVINGQKTVCVIDDVELVASGVEPIPEPPQPEPVIGDSGISLTDILLIVLVVLIAIMVVILVLRLNRS